MKPLLALTRTGIILIVIAFLSCKKDAPVPSNPNSKPGSYGPGFNYEVPALIVYNGNLIAAHSDTVSQWNGSSWSILGSSLNGTVNAFAIYNGNLIAAAGDFVKMWNGSSWSTLGGGFNSSVNALIVYNGNLVAGGQFDTIGKGVANKIAQWNGASWKPLADSGMQVWSKGIYALTIYNGNLIMGGSFSFLGKDTANNIASYDGAKWSNIGGKLVLGLIYSLATYAGNLFAGGAFVNAIGIDSLKYVAQWTGSSWTTLGNSMIGTGYYGGPVIFNLSVYNNNLIVGGQFYSVGSSNACGLAQWNGSSWAIPFGNIVVNQPIYWEPDLIYSSTVYNGDLIIGGVFSSVGGVLASNIAQWNGSSWSPL